MRICEQLSLLKAIATRGVENECEDRIGFDRELCVRLPLRIHWALLVDFFFFLSSFFWASLDKRKLEIDEEKASDSVWISVCIIYFMLFYFHFASAVPVYARACCYIVRNWRLCFDEVEGKTLNAAVSTRLVVCLESVAMGARFVELAAWV